jgi:hypothetical protein
MSALDRRSLRQGFGIRLHFGVGVGLDRGHPSAFPEPAMSRPFPARVPRDVTMKHLTGGLVSHSANRSLCLLLTFAHAAIRHELIRRAFVAMAKRFFSPRPSLAEQSLT